MAAPHALGLAVLDRLHVGAVAPAIAPHAVAGKVGGDEDRFARFRNDPLDFDHVRGKRADLLGRQVIEDRAQFPRELAAVLDGGDGEGGAEDCEEEPQQLERRSVDQVPLVCGVEHFPQHAAPPSKPDSLARIGGARLQSGVGGRSPVSLTRPPARLSCRQVAMGANRFRRGQRTFRRMQGTSGPNDNVELALAA